MEGWLQGRYESSGIQGNLAYSELAKINTERSGSASSSVVELCNTPNDMPADKEDKYNNEESKLEI